LILTEKYKRWSKEKHTGTYKLKKVKDTTSTNEGKTETGIQKEIKNGTEI